MAFEGGSELHARMHERDLVQGFVVGPQKNSSDPSQHPSLTPLDEMTLEESKSLKFRLLLSEMGTRTVPIS